MSQTSFQPSFWDPQDPQEKLMQENPILGRLAKVIPWEDFRRLLESIFDKEGKSPVGRKHTDVSIMFRLLVLQQYLNCSDMRLEYHVRNNQCLRYFVGLGVKERQLWIRRPGLEGNISVGTPLLEIGSPPQDDRKTTFSPQGGNCWVLWCTQESCSAPKGSAQLDSCLTPIMDKDAWVRRQHLSRDALSEE